jgi:ABC-type multidrug transport system ATPase subunit
MTEISNVFCVCQTRRPVMCCDEISTGLDAATTFDITRTLSLVTQLTQTIRIVSLLQPPPETVANFDDLILVHEGKIIYMGPVEEVVEHFNSLGYAIPDRMDVADWLQALPTKDGWQFLKEIDLDVPYKSLAAKHLTPEQFREKFNESKFGLSQLEQVEAPVGDDAEIIRDIASRKFQNAAFTSLKLVAGRELLLWWRDKYAIKMKLVQNIIMGVLVGTLFFQQGGESPPSIMGVLFQVTVTRVSNSF